MNSDLQLSTRAHPDGLLEAWMALRSERPHTHDPEAAEILGVPEAALHASRVGRGVVALTTDLHNILAPVPTWRRVFVVNRTLFGVNIHSLKVEAVAQESANDIRLNDGCHDIRILTEGVHQCFYFEDQTEHGRSAGLAWFNRAGHVLGKLLLRSKEGQDEAKPHILKHLAAEQSRVFTAVAGAEVTAIGLAQPQSAGVDEAVETVHELLPDASESGCLITAIGMHSQGMVSHYRAPLAKSNSAGPWVHASSVDFKCHLRLGAAVQAQQHKSTTTQSNEICLIDALGGRLTFNHRPVEENDLVNSSR